MKKVLMVAAILALGITAFAQSEPYKQVGKYNLSGDGFWDYVKYDPTGNRLFIAHNSTILVVDASNGNKLGEMPSKGAHGTALVPEKNLGFYTNGQAGTVTVFDMKTLQPKTEIKAGEGPDAIIYDEYSKKVIAMNGRSKDISVIDPGTLKVEKSVPLGGKLEFAASDPGHVYVNVEDKGEIAVVDSKTWTDTAHWKLDGCEEPSGLAIDEKRNVLFAVCGNAKMFVVDTKSGKTVATIPTGDGTDAAAYDPGLNRAFASNGQAATLTVVGEKGGKYVSEGNVATQKGARTMALDLKSHKVFLVTAELGPPAEGQRRPTIKPGTFTLLVYAPAK